MMRAAIPFALMGLLATATGAEAADCKPISMITQVQMTQLAGYNIDLAPLNLNGKQANLLFDTGGSMTQVSKAAAQTLGLVVALGNIGMYDMRGQLSHDMASVREFSLGTMKGSFGHFPINPNMDASHPDPFDGILALDYLRLNDVEADFGTDTLTIISPDHCPGYVPFAAGTVGVVPFTKSQDMQQLVVKVVLDGRELNALVDTGASQTSMRNDIAETLFKLTLGAADTPENKYGLNGDANLKTYRHVFTGLSLGDITVKNAHINIYPNALGSVSDRWGQATRLARNDIINAPQMIIGMDILRHLRIFMAFGEGKLYVTPAAAKAQTTLASSAALQAAYKKSTLATIASMMQQTAANSSKSAFWNNLCFLRATVKEDLDAAADACKHANELQPNNVHIMDNIAFVLYQKGDYKAALAAYDANLALNPKHPDSLYMRGFAKGKLGDQDGKDADIAVAKSINPRIVAEFAPYDIEY